MIDVLDVLVLDLIAGEDALQHLHGLLGEGGGSTEDLDVQGLAEIVSRSGVRRSTGANDGVSLVVCGNDASVVRLCTHN